MTDTTDNEWLLPFGSDRNAIARWKTLVEYWNKETGLELGEIPCNIPKNCHVPPLPVRMVILEGGVEQSQIVKAQPIEFIAWEGQNEQLTEAITVAILLRRANSNFLSKDEIDCYRKSHDKMVKQLEIVIYNQDFYSVEAVEAALLLTNLPNPYPKGEKSGDKFVKSANAQARREVRWVLNSIRTKDLQPLSDKALTVLWLLTIPFAGFRHGLWWSDDPKWGWTPHLGNEPPINKFFNSDNFQNLNEETRKDKSEMTKQGHPPIL